jgi:hypothetical protein
MRKIFKSKVDKFIVVLTIFPLLFTLIFFLNKGDLLPSILILIIAIFVSSIFLKTNYIVKNEILHIKSSFLINLEIEIKSINKIQKSNSWEKSPALSLDRIEILYNEKPAVRYNFFEHVIISPADKQEFIDSLLKINPSIEVDL